MAGVCVCSVYVQLCAYPKFADERIVKKVENRGAGVCFNFELWRAEDLRLLGFNQVCEDAK